MAEEPFSRLELLYGEENLRILQDAEVLLCGTGGVGSWAAEALARSAVGHITLVDFDLVRPSNLNRQLCALHSTIGQPKIQVLAERLRDINPAISVTTMPLQLTPENCDALLLSKHWDCVIDAIDDRPAKLQLLRTCVQNRIFVVSSMGAALKQDLRAVRVDDISKSKNCRLARAIRKQLHREGITTGIQVVYSEELPPKPNVESEPEEEGEKRPLPSSVFLPALFGLHCANAAIQGMLKKVIRFAMEDGHPARLVCTVSPPPAGRQ